MTKYLTCNYYNLKYLTVLKTNRDEEPAMGRLLVGAEKLKKTVKD